MAGSVVQVGRRGEEVLGQSERLGRACMAGSRLAFPLAGAGSTGIGPRTSGGPDVPPFVWFKKPKAGTLGNFNGLVWFTPNRPEASPPARKDGGTTGRAGGGCQGLKKKLKKYFKGRLMKFDFRLAD